MLDSTIYHVILWKKAFYQTQNWGQKARPKRINFLKSDFTQIYLHQVLLAFIISFKKPENHTILQLQFLIPIRIRIHEAK